MMGNSTPAQDVANALAKCLLDWASDLRAATDHTEFSRRMLTIGRLEGLSIGLSAIATLASSDPSQEPPDA